MKGYIFVNIDKIYDDRYYTFLEDFELETKRLLENEHVLLQLMIKMIKVQYLLMNCNDIFQKMTVHSC